VPFGKSRQEFYLLMYPSNLFYLGVRAHCAFGVRVSMRRMVPLLSFSFSLESRQELYFMGLASPGRCLPTAERGDPARRRQFQ
jgi:hypothetical protein